MQKNQLKMVLKVWVRFKINSFNFLLAQKSRMGVCFEVEVFLIANQCTGFYMTGTSNMKELIREMVSIQQ